MGNTLALIECIISNGLQRAGQDNFRQAIRAVECIVRNADYTFRYGDALQLGASAKDVRAGSRPRGRIVNTTQILAVGECTIMNRCYTIRKFESRKTITSIESITTDFV